MVVFVLDKRSLTLLTATAVLVGAALFAGGLVSGLYWGGGAATAVQGDAASTVVSRGTVSRPQRPAPLPATSSPAPEPQPTASPAEPAPSVPAPAEPAPSVPVPAEPTPADPTSAQPTPAEPTPATVEPASATSVTTSWPQTGSGRPLYSVQVAAYSVETNARRDHALLLEAGYRPMIKSQGAGTRPQLYLVLLGEFPSRAEADRLAGQFRLAAGRPAFVRSLEER